MKIVYIILFFISYHFILELLFKKIKKTKVIFYMIKYSTLSILFLGVILPILILLFIFNFDNYLNIGFVISLSFMYTKYFFNYKILKNDSTN